MKVSPAPVMKENGVSPIPKPSPAPVPTNGAATPAAKPSPVPTKANAASPAAGASANAKASAPAPAPAPKADVAAPAGAQKPTPTPTAAEPTPPHAPSPTPPSPDPAQFEAQLLNALRAIWRELREVKELLRSQQAQVQTSPASTEVRAPNLKRVLKEYPTFDWEAIGAKVLSTDEDGATAVAWGGNTFVRRTNPKFGAEIWFSRATGRGEDGEVNYERLITFAEPPEVEPLPKAVRQRLG